MKKQNPKTEKVPVKKRNYKHGDPVTKKILIGLTEREYKKLMRKVGDRTITDYFKKVTKLV